MNRKLLVSALGAATFLLASVTSAFAHVVVKPSETGISESQTFTIEVPTEKDNPTVGVRVVLPSGLQEVNPVVNPGWTITEKENGTGEDAEVTEINWTGGQIPAGQMEIFSFRAQVPDMATTLNWKAYQTYSDGSIVAWDQKPGGSDDATGDKGPYSETKIVNDLTSNNTTKTDSSTMWIAIGALALAAVSMAMNLRKK